MSKNLTVLTLILLLVLASPFHCIAQEEKGGGDLAAKTQNPVGAMYSLPFKFTFDYGAANGEATFLNIQPVIPVTVGDWNLINRVIVPLIDTPGLVTGNARDSESCSGRWCHRSRGYKLFSLSFSG